MKIKATKGMPTEPGTYAIIWKAKKGTMSETIRIDSNGDTWSKDWNANDGDTWFPYDPLGPFTEPIQIKIE